MATRTCANGGGNWSAIGTWVEGAVPTSADDVVFTATSGNLTVDTTANCRSLDFTGYVGVLTWSNQTINIGTSSVPASNIALKQAATYTVSSTGGRVYNFVSTVTGGTLTCAGIGFPQTAFNGAGGGWTFQDTVTSITNLSATAGTVNTNNVSFAGFTGSTAITVNGGTLNLGSSAISVASTTGILTYTSGTINAGTSTITCTATSGTPSINTGTASLNNLTINGVGTAVTVSAGGQLNCSGAVTLTAGTLNTNGQTCSWNNFTTDTGVGTNKTLTLGASQITCSGGDASGNGWNFTSSSSITFNAGTSTIILSRTAAALRTSTGPYTFYNVSFTGGGAANTNITTGTVFNNFSRIGTASKTDSFSTNTNFTVNGVFTVTGQSLTNRLLVQSAAVGAQRTISLGTTGTVSATNTDFMDFNFTGTSTPATGTSLGDVGGNSNITFTTPVTRYWVATGGGSASATTSWSTSSGGGSGASVPLAQDTIVFDSPSITAVGKTVTFDMPVSPGVDFTNVLNTPNFSVVNAIRIVGSLNLTGAAAVNQSTWTLAGRGSYSLTTNNQAFTGAAGDFQIAAPTGTYTLQDNANFGGRINLIAGTLDMTGRTVTSLFFSSQAGTVARAITMTSGTWTLSGTGNVWLGNTTAALLTQNLSGSTLVLSDNSATAKTLVGQNQNFGNLIITGGKGTPVTIQNGNTFSNFSVTNPDTVVTLNAATTTTVTGFNATGSPNAYLYVPQGGTTQSAFIVDAAIYKISGDIDIRSLIWFDAVNPGQTINIGPTRDDGSTNRCYAFRQVSGGFLNFFHSATGGGTSSASSSVAIATPTGPLWYRVTWTASTGACNFYTSPDNITYTQLGTTQTIDAGTTTWTGGAVNQFVIANSGGFPPAGKYYRTQLYNGINGTLVIDANFATKAFGANSFTESSVNAATVTINGTSAQAGDGRILINSSIAGTAATLSYTGSGVVSCDYLTLKDITALPATLSVASLIKQTSKVTSGAISFIGNILAGTPITYLLTATLSFVGKVTKATTRGLPAASLSFTGVVGKKMSLAITKFTGTLSFAGAFLTGAVHKLALIASLAFSGAINKFTKRAIIASLAFTGAFIYSFVKTFTATLALRGETVKAITRPFTATLGLIGNWSRFAAVKWVAIKVTIFGGGKSTTVDSNATSSTVQSGAKAETLPSGTNSVTIASGSKNTTVTSGDKET